MGNVQLPLHRNSSPANRVAATQYIRGCGEVLSCHRNGEGRGIVVHLSISQAAAHLLDSLHNSLWALQRVALKKRQYLMSGSGEEENIWLSLFVTVCPSPALEILNVTLFHQLLLPLLVTQVQCPWRLYQCTVCVRSGSLG